MSSFVSSVALPSPLQRQFDAFPPATPVPKILSCDRSDTATVDETVQWVIANQDEITENLRTHGAVLFRGFPLRTAVDFDRFVSAFRGYVDFPYEESLSYAVRLKVEGTSRVCTANEGKNGGLVFHHEQAQAPFYPSRLFFYCLARDMSQPGGATAICPSAEVFRRVNAKYPDFIRKLRQHGVQYTAVLQQHPDGGENGVGRGWDNFFGCWCDNKAEVEARMTELGYTWEWLAGEAAEKVNQLKLVTPVLQAVREVPGKDGEWVFFNQLGATFANAAEFARATGGDPDVDQYVKSGDGSSLPRDAMEYALKQCEDTAVEVEWQQGDVALLDNFQVMHARRPFEGKGRKVLVSLTKSDELLKKPVSKL